MKFKPLDIIRNLIFPAIFNLCYFMSIEAHTPVRWISYGIVHVAWILAVLTITFPPKRTDNLVHKYPRQIVAMGFFIVTLVVAILLIVINGDSIKVPIIVYSILSACSLGVYLVLMRADTLTGETVERTHRNVQLLRKWMAQVNHCKMLATDIRIRKEIEKIYDAIASAQVETVAGASAVESEIEAKISALEHIVKTESFDGIAASVKELLLLVEQRNSIIRVSH